MTNIKLTKKDIENLTKYIMENLKKELGTQNNNSNIIFDENLQIIVSNDIVSTSIETIKTYNKKK